MASSGVPSSIAASASDFIMPDLMKVGGVTGWLRVAGQAEAASIPMSSHLFAEASAHMLAVTPTAHWLEYADWWNPIMREPLKFVAINAVAASFAFALGLECLKGTAQQGKKALIVGVIGLGFLRNEFHNKPAAVPLSQYATVALRNLDAVIKLIRASADAEAARTGLMQQFGAPAPFVGLDNYVALVTDPYLWTVVVRSIVFCVVTAVVTVAIGGAMANTFLQAQGIKVGKSLVEKDMADTARRILAKAVKCDLCRGYGGAPACIASSTASCSQRPMRR